MRRASVLPWRCPMKSLLLAALAIGLMSGAAHAQRDRDGRPQRDPGAMSAPGTVGSDRGSERGMRNRPPGGQTSPATGPGPGASSGRRPSQPAPQVVAPAPAPHRDSRFQPRPIPPPVVIAPPPIRERPIYRSGPIYAPPVYAPPRVVVEQPPNWRYRRAFGWCREKAERLHHYEWLMQQDGRVSKDEARIAREMRFDLARNCGDGRWAPDRGWYWR
jgi:hypothetical protein